MSAHARIEQPLRSTRAEGVPSAAHPEPRTPLSVVPAPLPRSGPGVGLFSALVLLGALVLVLVMNITVSNRQYDLLELREEQQAVTEANERLSEQVGHLEAPQNLAARAESLGMVTPAGTASVDLGTGEIAEAVGESPQASLSATYVAPPAASDAGPRAPAAPDSGAGRIEGPRTVQGPAPAAPAPSGTAAP